jgi:hypothetical protein
MKATTALLLLVIGVVVAAGGWYFGLRGDEVVTQQPTAQLAFPGLAGKLADASKVELQQGGASLTLERKGDVWGIADKSDYPALPDKLHTLFVNLAELRLVEPRTADPALLDRLGLADPKAPGSTAGLVQVFDSKGTVLAALLVGHRRVSARGGGGAGSGGEVYVRRPNEEQSWLADGALDVTTAASSWMAHDLTNIDRAKIAAVEVTHPDATLSFTGKDGKLTLTSPADHPPLDESKLDDVARALEYLSSTDVVTADKQPGTPAGSAVFKTTDGLTVTAKVTVQDKEPWVALTAAGDGAAADQAKDLSKLFDGWAYQVGNWKLAALVPKLDDLKAPPPAAPTAQPPAAAPAKP